MVMEQIANLSTGNCRQGSSPCLSAKSKSTIDNQFGVYHSEMRDHPKSDFIKWNRFLVSNFYIFCKRYLIINSGCSVARLSRHVWDVEAAGSNPATPTLEVVTLEA